MSGSALTGFATTDLSVRFRDACQGGGAYGKTAAPRPFPALFVMPHAFALIRVQLTPAAAERPERSDRVSEEASYHRNPHFLPYTLSLHFPLSHEALSLRVTRRNILSQYTLR